MYNEKPMSPIQVYQHIKELCSDCRKSDICKFKEDKEHLDEDFNNKALIETPLTITLACTAYEPELSLLRKTSEMEG